MRNNEKGDNHYDLILEDGSLIVGDYHVAQDVMMLKSLGVTHIVSCGFTRGVFPLSFR